MEQTAFGEVAKPKVTESSEAFISGEKVGRKGESGVSLNGSIGDSDNIHDKPETVLVNGDNVEEKPEEDEWLDILGSGQLKKRIITPGRADSRPQKSEVIRVQYVGRLEDGKIVEDVESAEINLGDNELVHGLDFALPLMDEGEEAEIIVGSRFAYGTLGRDPDIPPEATLRYTVKLLEVNPEPLVATLGFAERLAVGLRKKERGNWWYNRDEFTLAINCYRRALEYFDDTEFPDGPSEDEVRTLLDERLKTYNNLGAAQIKISGYDAALISFGHVLAAQPRNVKALYRKSTILKEKGELQEAIAVMQTALSIEPDNRKLQNDLQNLLAAQRRDNTKQRDLYKKMMGNSQEPDKKNNSDKSSKTSAIVLMVATAIAVAMAGIVAVRYNKM